jgi:hypothetical protein
MVYTSPPADVPALFVQTYHRSIRRQQLLPIDFDRPEHVAAMIERRRHKKRLARSKQRRRCRYCGRCIAHRKHAEIDHVVPKSRGGSDHPRNLVLCCFECNRSKGDFLPEEWAASILSVVGMRPVAVIPDPLPAPRRRRKPRGRLRALAAAILAALPFLAAKGGGH